MKKAVDEVWLKHWMESEGIMVKYPKKEVKKTARFVVGVEIDGMSEMGRKGCA